MTGVLRWMPLLIVLMGMAAVAWLAVRNRRRWVAAATPLFDSDSVDLDTSTLGSPRLVANYRGILATVGGAGSVALHFRPADSSCITFQIRRKPRKFGKIAPALPLALFACVVFLARFLYFPRYGESFLCLMILMYGYVVPYPPAPSFNAKRRVAIALPGSEALECSSPHTKELQRLAQDPEWSASLLRIFGHDGVKGLIATSATGATLILGAVVRPRAFGFVSREQMAEVLPDLERIGQLMTV